ncbi:hypothetical protein B0W48_05720 [Pseudoalteromonas aliena]|uniref:Uncharacterized protein n=1 Tax=Pseudoalteromonas aliena TaxID=247523 RepID=A0A1Q2GW90_9GAMM|nr:hypothetical protein [Pseudoalteromonas aliena]AQP99347.1 hypothetical protein B0W48_05720 [Pseudoalteromonas aliena]
MDNKIINIIKNNLHNKLKWLCRLSHGLLFKLDHKRITSQSPFYVYVLFIPVLFFLIFGYGIWKDYSFELSWKAFYLWFEISKISLSFLALSLPIGAFLFRIHASVQNEHSNNFKSDESILQLVKDNFEEIKSLLELKNVNTGQLEPSKQNWQRASIVILHAMKLRGKIKTEVYRGEIDFYHGKLSTELATLLTYKNKPLPAHYFLGDSNWIDLYEKSEPLESVIQAATFEKFSLKINKALDSNEIGLIHIKSIIVVYEFIGSKIREDTAWKFYRDYSLIDVPDEVMVDYKRIISNSRNFLSGLSCGALEYINALNAPEISEEERYLHSVLANLSCERNLLSRDNEPGSEKRFFKK